MKSLAQLVLLLSFPLLLPACTMDEDGQSSTGASSESSGDGDGDDQGDGDGDGDDQGDGDGDDQGDGDGDAGAQCWDELNIPLTYCEFPSPCEDAYENDPDFDLVGECMLGVLGTGDPAFLRLRSQADEPGFGEEWTLLLMGDGTVVWTFTMFQDLDSENRETWRELPNASYFENCSAATFAELLTCVEGIAQTECQLGVPTCPGESTGLTAHR